jgi:hypothetical protein
MKIFLIFIIAVFTYAQITLIKVNNKEGLIDKYVQEGRSGYVLCPFNNKEIICARAVFFGKKVKFYNYEELKNDAFALPIVYPKKGNKVIVNSYERILIIAPNQDIYLKLKDLYSSKTIIHPDLLYVYLDGEVSKKGFQDFARLMNIDEYIFALDKVYEVDANSFYSIKSFSKLNTFYKFIFYNSYNKGETSQNMIKKYKSFIKGLK